MTLEPEDDEAPPDLDVCSICGKRESGCDAVCDACQDLHSMAWNIQSERLNSILRCKEGPLYPWVQGRLGGDGFPGNAWLKYPWGQVYVRWSKRPLPCTEGEDRRMWNVLDIAAVEVKQRLRGQGHFTRFLHDVEECIFGEMGIPIYIENVMQVRFAKFFHREEWEEHIVRDGSPQLTSSFWRLPPIRLREFRP